LIENAAHPTPRLSPLSKLRALAHPFTLFPYTTLFRSSGLDHLVFALAVKYSGSLSEENARDCQFPIIGDETKKGKGGSGPDIFRSEEHTSELQSRFDLVCRLLLEKKIDI